MALESGIVDALILAQLAAERTLGRVARQAVRGQRAAQRGSEVAVRAAVRALLGVAAAHVLGQAAAVSAPELANRAGVRLLAEVNGALVHDEIAVARRAELALVALVRPEARVHALLVRVLRGGDRSNGAEESALRGQIRRAKWKWLLRATQTILDARNGFSEKAVPNSSCEST